MFRVALNATFIVVRMTCHTVEQCCFRCICAQHAIHTALERVSSTATGLATRRVVPAGAGRVSSVYVSISALIFFVL